MQQQGPAAMYGARLRSGEASLEGARGSAASALSDATHGADSLIEAVRYAPELAERVRPLTEQLFAAADVARTVEHELAGLLAERRRDGR